MSSRLMIASLGFLLSLQACTVPSLLEDTSDQKEWDMITEQDLLIRAMKWSGLKSYMTVEELKEKIIHPHGNITVINKEEVLTELQGLPENKLLKRRHISHITQTDEKDTFDVMMGPILLHLEYIR